MDINELNRKVLNGDILSYDSDIVNLYVNIHDINKYRCFVNELEINNCYLKDIIDKKRKEKYDREVSLIDDRGLLNLYSDIYNSFDDNNQKNEYFKKLYDSSSDYFQMMLIDKYFEDIPYNFIINLNMMLKFIESIDIDLIDKDRLNLYYMIINFNNLNIDDKKNLYYDMDNGTDYISLFYDDYRKCKDYAYSLYNNRVINVDNMSLSTEYDVPVYEINGEDFMAVVHQTHIMRNDPFRFDIWNNTCNDDMTTSFSVIDNNHLDTIFFDTFVMLGFSNLDIDRIIHIYHSDSMSKDGSSHRINEIVTPDMLMKNTTGYNELLYMESNEMMRENICKHSSLYPSYIMCYDEIYDNEIRAAKEYGIPIVLVNTKKYVRNRIRTIDLNPDNYKDRSDFM